MNHFAPSSQSTRCRDSAQVSAYSPPVTLELYALEMPRSVSMVRVCFLGPSFSVSGPVHSITPMNEGLEAWNDRPYTLTDVPQLLNRPGNWLLHFPARSTGAITVTAERHVITVYVAVSSDPRHGGLASLLDRDRSWTRISETAMGYSGKHKDRSHSGNLGSIFCKEVPAASSVTLPSLMTESECSMVMIIREDPGLWRAWTPPAAGILYQNEEKISGQGPNVDRTKHPVLLGQKRCPRKRGRGI